MSKAQEIFVQLALVRQQFEREYATKQAMLAILDQAGIAAEELPENGEHVLSFHSAHQLFRFVQTTDIEYIECNGYLCFKVETPDGAEQTYIVSPFEVLMTEDGLD